jgi:hypothetical protein
VKSKTNRYRDPRIRYNLEGWTRKKPSGIGSPQLGKQAMGFGRRKKGKS